MPTGPAGQAPTSSPSSPTTPSGAFTPAATSSRRSSQRFLYRFGPVPSGRTDAEKRAHECGLTSCLPSPCSAKGCFMLYHGISTSGRGAEAHLSRQSFLCEATCVPAFQVALRPTSLASYDQNYACVKAASDLSELKALPRPPRATCTRPGGRGGPRHPRRPGRPSPACHPLAVPRLPFDSSPSPPQSSALLVR